MHLMTTVWFCIIYVTSNNCLNTVAKNYAVDVTATILKAVVNSEELFNILKETLENEENPDTQIITSLEILRNLNAFNPKAADGGIQMAAKTFVKSQQKKIKSKVIGMFENSEFSPNCSKDLAQHLGSIASLDFTKGSTALQMLDASSKIFEGNARELRGFSIGHSDACFSQNSLKYCTLLAELRKTLWQKATWGLCLPSTCTKQDIVVLAKVLHTHLFRGKGNILIGEQPCFSEQEASDYQMSTATKISIVLLLLLLITTIWSSVSDALRKDHEKDSSQQQWTTMFSIQRNFQDLFYPKRSFDRLASVDGIKCFYMQFVALCHVWMSFNFGGCVNNARTYNDQLSNHALSVAIIFSPLEPFFFMSGFFTCLSLLNSVATGRFNPAKSIIQRYLRMIPTVAFLFLLSAVAPMIFKNPRYNEALDNMYYECTGDVYLKFLTFTSSLFYKFPRCHSNLWSLSTDFHLYIVTVVLFMVMKRHRFAAVLISVLFYITGVSYAAYRAYTEHFSITPFAESEDLLDVYTKAWYRYPPWFIGMCLALILAKDIHSNKKRTMTKFQVTAGWTISACLFISLVVFIRNFEGVNGIPLHTKLDSGIHHGLNGTVSSLIYCWIIYSSFHGYGGVIGKFYSSKYFRPVARISLSYMVIHLSYQLLRSASGKAPVQLEYHLIYQRAFSDSLSSLILALLLHLLVEMPFGRLSSIFLQKMFPSKTKSAVSTKEKKK